MEQVKIGWAKREISIEDPVSMPGQFYMRISTGIHDPLYVTALCVDGGKGQDAAIFIGCDLVALRGGVIDITIEKVKKRNAEIPSESIIFSVTHTHAGPCLIDTPPKTPDGQDIYPGEKYREFFTDMCAEAITEAWESRKAGGIAFGYGYATVAHSRRVIYFDDVSKRIDNPYSPNGHGVMYGKTNDENFSHYEAGTDAYVNLMYTFNQEKKLTGILINVPCPSQLSERFTKLSADYWNEVRENVKTEFGKDVFVLPQCAAGGDLSPRTLHYMEAQARRMRLKYNLGYNLPTGRNTPDEYNKVMGERRDIAERILVAVKEVYGWASKEIQTELPVKHVFKTINLARRMITEEEKAWCEETIEKMKDRIPTEGTPEEIREAVSKFEALKRRNNIALERYKEQNETPTHPMKMHIVRIGEIAFATNRFEVYIDFMHRLQARSPFLQTFVMQLAGEEDKGGCYLATERGVKNKGYSASLFCNQLSPEGGQQIVEETLKVLNEMMKEDS